jgi:hypothetical protein
MHKDRTGTVEQMGRALGQRHEIGAAYKGFRQKL